MRFAINPTPAPTVAVLGVADRFPVRRIFCVGRNYADHVREMGNDPRADPPVFFTKPGDAVVESGAVIPYPLNTANLHHEVELVMALKHGGENIEQAAALSCVWGYAVGVDLTRRDRQAEAKEAGAPWDAAKAFDNSAPLGPLTPAAVCGDLQAGDIWLRVNDEERQRADLSDMIWRTPEIIAALSGSWALAPGDLIFTGTPAGVGALRPGDRVTCGVDGLAPLSFSIAER